MKIKNLLLGFSFLLGLLAGALLQYGPNLEAYARASSVGDSSVSASSDEPHAWSRSPVFFNDFNVFRSEEKSEDELFKRYGSHLAETDPEKFKPYTQEILSYLDRITNSENPRKDQLLPLKLGDRTTYGRLLTYLFNRQTDPMAYAKSRGLVDPKVNADDRMSAKVIMDVIGKLFLLKGNAHDALASAGLLNAPELWKSEEHEYGINLMNTLTVISRLIEVLERTNIAAYRKDYVRQETDLPQDHQVTMGESLKVLLGAFNREMNDGKFTAPDAMIAENLKTKLKNRMSETLTSMDVTVLRAAFYAEQQKEAPELFEAPESIDVGTCTYLDKKLVFPPIARIGVNGFSVTCDGHKFISIQKGGYAINLSFPKLTPLENDAGLLEGASRLDLIHDYRNTLLVSSDGEQRLVLENNAEGSYSANPQEFEFAILDKDMNELSSGSKEKSLLGDALSIWLRTLPGVTLFAYGKDL